MTGKDMKLPACQNHLIESVAKVQPNLVVVLHNGSPVETPWAEQTAAILEMYLGGQGVGEACDRLLYGQANPSGRLAETFPLRLEDNPSYLSFGGDGKTVDYTRRSTSDTVIMRQRNSRYAGHSDMDYLTQNLSMIT